MPKIKTTRTKQPPEGFEEIEGVLDDYAKKMRDAENESHEGKRKTEALWPIMRINHARSRYIYELYYKREAVSRALYDWLLKQGYADAKCVTRRRRRCTLWSSHALRQFNREMEEDGLREAVLRTVHPDKGLSRSYPP